MIHGEAASFLLAAGNFINLYRVQSRLSSYVVHVPAIFAVFSSRDAQKQQSHERRKLAVELDFSCTFICYIIFQTSVQVSSIVRKGKERLAFQDKCRCVI